MNKILSLFIAFLFTTIFYCYAQEPVPGIKWQATFGGSGSEAFSGTNKTFSIDRDGGYLIGCTSSSNDGNMAGIHYSGSGFLKPDIWVAKLDSQRNISWSAFLGGTDQEYIASLLPAHDSGYIVAGSTESADGDITRMQGKGDAWIVRLGSKGNIVWQKTFGGSENDDVACMAKTNDGYIFAGSTFSNDGDVSGLHGTQRDVWLVKLDKNGNILWQKCLGGSSWDVPTAIKETVDGGFILTGLTTSNDGDVQGLHAHNTIAGQNADIWVVKLDGNGTIEWQKCLGGTKEDRSNDIELTATGGFIIAGYTESPDGDVTGYHGIDTAQQTGDAWVINLSATGDIIWQRSFGGTRYDEFNDIKQLPDHSFVAVGTTNSPNGDVSHVNGKYFDCWLVKFNNAGNIIWEKTFGDSITETGVNLSLTAPGNLLVAGWVVNDWNGDDKLWLFEAGSINTIAGRVFYDANSDGIQNNGESAFDKVTIRSEKNGDTTSVIPVNGFYTLNIDTGTFSTKAVPYNNYYTIVPATQIATFNSYFNIDSIHFAVQPLPGIRDVTISMVPLIAARPGFTVQYKLLYGNVGTNTVGTGHIELVKDSRLSFISSVPAATSVNGDTIRWNYSSLNPNEEAVIILNFSVGGMPSVNLGDTLKSITWINQDGTDVTPVDDTITLKQIVRGSFDPNDKTEANAGVITPAQVNNGEYLNYTIRFQNTGTDTAYNITIRDTLEKRLDWNTLQMISASNAYQLFIEEGNKLTWQFNNIKLPYAAIDEPNSHGYIAYRIKPKPTVHAGDTIKNTAGIYFDYNLPVTTNTEKTIVFMVFTPLPVNLLSFLAVPEGPVVNVTWKTGVEENVRHFEVLRSANGVDFTTIGIVQPGQITYLFKDKQPLPGYNYYRLRSVDIDGKNSLSTIVLVNVKNGADVISSLYPNPANGNITLKLQGAVEGNVLVQVLDQQGRQIMTKQFGVQHTGAFKTPLQLGGLSKGSYVLRIMVDDKVYLHKLLIP